VERKFFCFSQPENTDAEANVVEPNTVEETAVEEPQEVGEDHEWTILGEHRFVEKKILS
jgi:hypothetical protein